MTMTIVKCFISKYDLPLLVLSARKTLREMMMCAG